MSALRKTAFGILLVALLLSIGLLHAQDTTTMTTIPIGGGYADTFAGFIAAAVQQAKGDTINILVMPPAYSTSSEVITDDERQTNISDAEERRLQIEEACNAGIPAGKACSVVLMPLFTRPDALDEANLSYFVDDLAAIYFLGGDQDIAMQSIMDTPIEAALQAAYEGGTILAGTSAGLSLQSRTMIGGYVGDFGPESGLNAGAVDVWNTADKRGLSFGLENVVLEQHFWERGRIARLLNTLAQPGVPQVGLGVDTYTSITITNKTTASNVFGLYEAVVLDAETYGAANGATFKNDILDMHHVVFHLLAPGDFAYDLTTRQPSLAAVPATIERTATTVTLPEGAGALLLAGNLGSILDSQPAALSRFLELSGSNVLIVATGYATPDEAQTAIAAYQAALGADAPSLILEAGTAAEMPADPTTYGGILVVAPDQSTVQADLLEPVLSAWRAGKPLLLDNAAAAIAGTFYAANAPIAEDDTDTVQNAFLNGQTTVKEGLGLLPIMVEPAVMSNYRWGRLVSLAYAHPDTLAFGLPDNAALEVSASGTTVIGTNGVFALDLHAATLGMGTNNAYVFANGLLDVFAPGEPIQLTGAGS